jgi:hypothetical protein
MKLKKTSFLILLICCFSFAMAQKKKIQKNTPPKIEKIPTPIIKDQTVPNQIEYVAPPLAVLGNYERNETPKVLEKLKLYDEAKKCACPNVELILAADKMGEGITAKDYGLEGNVKNLKTIEKRDTLVGYSETLSKGNTVEMLFLENGLLSNYFIQNTSNKNLNSKTVLHYTTANQLTFIESFYGNNVKPVAKYIFQYDDEQKFYGILMELQQQKKIHHQMYECSKTENEFFVIKNQPDKENNREENELLVYNPKNQLIKKQKIINYKQNTIENNTTAYIFNDSGLLIEEQFLKKDGTIRNKLLHQYNKQGDIIKSTYKNGDYIVYDYKYDAQNNWIWKRKTEYEKSRFGSEMEITERLTWDRTIEYY